MNRETALEHPAAPPRTHPQQLQPPGPDHGAGLVARLTDVLTGLSPPALATVRELFETWFAAGGPEHVDLLGLVDALLPYWRLDELAKRPAPNRADVERITDWDRTSPGALGVHDLPQLDEPPAASLWDVVYRRRSQREFAPTRIPLEEVGTLLRRTAGATAMAREAYGIKDFPLRAYPTAGGLHGVSTYVYAQAVTGLAEGIYRFVPLTRCLESLQACDVRWKLSQISPPSEWAWDAAITVVLVGDLTKLTWKYGRRSYRLLHLEAGALMENLCLGAAALGWNACALATVDEDRVRWDLGLGRGEHVVTCLVAMGQPHDGEES